MNKLFREGGLNMDKPVRTKEEARNELFEKFKMKDTSDFQLALQQGRIEEAEAWLEYIKEHFEDFPQYKEKWHHWFDDRKNDIDIYRSKKEKGELKNITPRSKEDAQAELMEKFGFMTTAGFRDALKNGNIEKAESWLQYIHDNKDAFPQYQASWDKWLRDRFNELEQAKKPAGK